LIDKNGFQSSGGCFLYTDLVLNLFHDGKLQLKTSSLSMVPLSLSEIFLLEFNLRFPTQVKNGTRDRYI
jgi:hypothetical protein